MNSPNGVRSHLIVLLVLCLLSGCQRSETAAPVTDPGVFQKTAEIFEALLKDQKSALPNAILNEAKAVIIVPAGSTTGVGSWREGPNRWSVPQARTIQAKHRPGSDLLIVVLKPELANLLRTAAVQVSTPKSSSPGSLAQSTPVLAGVDLSSQSVAYERINGQLSGAEIDARIGAPMTPSGKQAGEGSRAQANLQKALVSFFNAIIPEGIIIHHTATLPVSDQVPKDKRAVDAYHSEKGFDAVCFGREYHVAYHYLILEDGTIQDGRPERCQGAHAFGYNGFLGISLVGDFSSKDNPTGSKGAKRPTPKQTKALVALCRRLMTRYHFGPQRVMRHSDVARTYCPGDRFPYRSVLWELLH